MIYKNSFFDNQHVSHAQFVACFHTFVNASKGALAHQGAHENCGGIGYLAGSQVSSLISSFSTSVVDIVCIVLKLEVKCISFKKTRPYLCHLTVCATFVITMYIH